MPRSPRRRRRPLPSGKPRPSQPPRCPPSWHTPRRPSKESLMARAVHLDLLGPLGTCWRLWPRRPGLSHSRADQWIRRQYTRQRYCLSLNLAMSMLRPTVRISLGGHPEPPEQKPPNLKPSRTLTRAHRGSVLPRARAPRAQRQPARDLRLPGSALRLVVASAPRRPSHALHPPRASRASARCPTIRSMTPANSTSTFRLPATRAARYPLERPEVTPRRQGFADLAVSAMASRPPAAQSHVEGLPRPILCLGYVARVAPSTSTALRSRVQLVSLWQP